MTEAHGGSTSGGKKDIATASDDTVDRSADRMSTTRAATMDDEVRDTSAKVLFDELKTESEADGPAVDEDASAESIIDDADGHDYERGADGGEAVTAGDEVNSMLIPDRTDGEEFRWIETDAEKSASETAEETTDGTENDLFTEREDLFAESENDEDEPLDSGDVTEKGGEDSQDVTDAEGDVDDDAAAENAIEGEAHDREDSTAFPSTTSPQRSIDDGDSADGDVDGSENGILTRLLSFFGLR